MTLYSLRFRMRSWGRKRASPFTRSVVCDPWPAFASERGVRSSCSSGSGTRASSVGGGCSVETCASRSHLLREGRIMSSPFSFCQERPRGPTDEGRYPSSCSCHTKNDVAAAGEHEEHV